MNINFAKLDADETKAIAIDAFNNLTTDDIFEVIKAARVQPDDLREWIARLEDNP